MTEYKSLETVIRETRAKDLRKRMEEAALKRGKVTAEVVNESKKPDLGHYAPPSHSDGADRVAVTESQESLIEISKEKATAYYDKAKKQATNLAKNLSSASPEEDKDTYFKRGKGVSMASHKIRNKYCKVPATEEVEPVEELLDDQQAGGQDPVKQKLAQQKQQLQKQKEQIRLQIAQQRAAKQEQKMKQNAEKALQKEEEDLDEWASVPYTGVHTFRNANRLMQLHQSRFQNLSRQNDPRSRRLAMLHRERAIELKRLAYNSKDNPEKLPTL